MKHLISTALVSLFFLSTFFAQNINISLHKSATFKGKKRGVYLTGTESDGNGGALAIVSGKDGYYLKHFDANFKKIKEVIIDDENPSLTHDGKYLVHNVTGMTIKNDNVNLLVFNMNNSLTKYAFNLLSAPIDNPNFKRRTLIELDKDFVKKYFKDFSADDLFFKRYVHEVTFGDVIFSENKNFFALNLNAIYKDLQVYQYVVFNDQFKQMYIGEFKNKDGRDFLIKNVAIDDNDGTIFITGKLYTGKSKLLGNKKPNYKYKIYKINKDGKTDVSFDTDNHFARDITTVYENGELTCTGFYSEKSDGRYLGVFRVDINPQKMTITKKSFLPFSNQFMTDRFGKGKKKKINGIVIRSAFKNKANDIILNGEEYYDRSMPTGSYNSQLRHEKFEDIISAKISASGKLIWSRNINKTQLYMTGYLSTFVNNKVYYFINASNDIKKLKGDRPSFKSNGIAKTNLFVIMLDENGDISYDQLTSAKKDKMTFPMSKATILGTKKNEILFFGEQKTSKQIVKVTIE